MFIHTELILFDDIYGGIKKKFHGYEKLFNTSIQDHE